MCGRLVADTKLEASWAPINELDGPLGLDDGHSSIDVLGNNVSTVKESTRHIFSFPGIALDHLVASFETRECHVSNRVLFMVCFFSRDDGSKSGEGEVDTGERNQVGLEFVQMTFRDPSKRKDAVIEETTCAISLFKLVNPGDEMPKFFLQMS